jgi:8-oxo-dGTP diphosphatase
MVADHIEPRLKEGRPLVHSSRRAMRSVRTAAKAIIIRDRKLLAVKCQDDAGIFYILPGGGQEFGETLHDALRRECQEEIGCDVRVLELVLVREYRGWRHEFNDNEHALELMFACSVQGEIDQAKASQRDKAQIGVEWLALDRLESYRLYPQALRPMLASLGRHATLPVYCGDIN